METRRLANGEVWSERDGAWRLVNADGTEYAPVSSADFERYAETILVQQLGWVRRHLEREHGVVTDWAAKFLPERALALVNVTHDREHGRADGVEAPRA